MNPTAKRDALAMAMGRGAVEINDAVAGFELLAQQDRARWEGLRVASEKARSNVARLETNDWIGDIDGLIDLVTRHCDEVLGKRK